MIYFLFWINPIWVTLWGTWSVQKSMGVIELRFPKAVTPRHGIDYTTNGMLTKLYRCNPINEHSLHDSTIHKLINKSKSQSLSLKLFIIMWRKGPLFQACFFNIFEKTQAQKNSRFHKTQGNFSPKLNEMVVMVVT